jgi:hypothetical protein
MEKMQANVVKDEENTFKKRWGFNGGFPWRRVEIWMNNIDMKIARIVSGNVILQIQNSDLIFHPFFYRF